MTYGQLVRASEALRKLSAMNFGVKDAYRIFKLNKQLESIYEFCGQQERSLAEKHHGQVLQDGSIRFADSDDEESMRIGEENAGKFLREIESFRNTEAECPGIPLTLSWDAFGDQTMSPNDIEALTGLIDFE